MKEPMRSPFYPVKIFLGLLLAILIAGCATKSTVISRKQERYAAYEALTPELKALVDAGKVKAGMSMDAVYIAWGNPSQQTSGGNTAGESVTWIYQAGYVQDTRYWGRYRMYDAYTPVTYVRGQVTFVNGLVTQWQTFPEPLN